MNLLVIPSNDNWCSEIQKNSEAPSAEKATHGQGPYFGGPMTHPSFSQATGRLTAFDAATGKVRWNYKSPTPLVAGVTLTASSLVFTGETGGYCDAIDGQSGKILWRFDLNDSVQGGVVTYSAKDAQFVAVVSGDGGVITKRTFPEIVGGNPAITIFGLAKK